MMELIKLCETMMKETDWARNPANHEAESVSGLSRVTGGVDPSNPVCLFQNLLYGMNEKLEYT